MPVIRYVKQTPHSNCSLGESRLAQWHCRTAATCKNFFFLPVFWICVRKTPPYCVFLTLFLDPLFGPSFFFIFPSTTVLIWSMTVRVQLYVRLYSTVGIPATSRITTALLSTVQYCTVQTVLVLYCTGMYCTVYSVQYRTEVPEPYCTGRMSTLVYIYCTISITVPYWYQYWYSTGTI